MGGLVLAVDDTRFGGFSALRWSQGRLVAVSDIGNWASFEPIEQEDRLVAIASLEIGELHGLDDEPLSGKDLGDAEALTSAENGDWLVSFERSHRIWRYGSLNGAAAESGVHQETILGALPSNSGVEAMAGTDTDLLLCAEMVVQDMPHCSLLDGESASPFAIALSPLVRELGGVPTDADRATNGTYYVLFRSFSPEDGPGAAIVEVTPDGVSEELAVLRPPVHNRQHGGAGRS